MYKLLLVTDRDEVKQAFLKIDNWEQMMFHPVKILSNVSEAIDYLQRHAIDAVGYSLVHADASPLHLYLSQRPSLPVFQTHKHDNTLRDELARIRHFLDRAHADDTDEDYDEQTILQMLRDELMHQLLRGQIHSEKELISRIKLVRANAAMNKPCYLFEFDLPQGEVYLTDRWHYGRDRLESAIRNNFFGRYVDGIYYDVAVLTPRHIRVFACPRMNSERAEEETRQMVDKRVFEVVNMIKNFLDLDLTLEQELVLPTLHALIRPEEETQEETR